MSVENSLPNLSQTFAHFRLSGVKEMPQRREGAKDIKNYQRGTKKGAVSVER